MPPKSPSKQTKLTYTAAFAPPSISPRKRALSAPSSSPSPAKKRAIGPRPTLSPSKRPTPQSRNIFEPSPAKTAPAQKSSLPKPALPTKISGQVLPSIKNPFLGPPSSQLAPQSRHSSPFHMPDERADDVDIVTAEVVSTPAVSEMPTMTADAPSIPNNLISQPSAPQEPAATKTISGPFTSRPSLPSSSVGSVPSSQSSSTTALPTNQAPRRRISNVFRSRRSSVALFKNPFAPAIGDITEKTTDQSISSVSKGSIDGPFLPDPQEGSSRSRVQSPAGPRPRSKSCDRETMRQAISMPSPTRGSPSPALFATEDRGIHAAGSTVNTSGPSRRASISGIPKENGIGLENEKGKTTGLVS